MDRPPAAAKNRFNTLCCKVLLLARISSADTNPLRFAQDMFWLQNIKGYRRSRRAAGA
jgi:hypothetical protein